MTTVQTLLDRKVELGRERDLCAELYNVWITKLHYFEDVPEKYELYMNMINNMEPYGQMLKEEIRDINRQLCRIEGVESIEDTPYTQDCVYKYGFDRPNSDD